MTHQVQPLPHPTVFDQRWAASLVRALDKFIQHLVFGDYTINGKLTTKNGRIKKQRLITAATGSILLTDEVIDANYAGAVTLTFSVPGETGQVWYVQDSSGAAASNPITIARPNASYNVNGGASVSLATNYGRLMIEYNGTQFVSSA